MTLLFITQKLTGQDSFGVLWVRAFIKRGYSVEVLCLEGTAEMYEFPVHSMGKERGAGKLKQLWNFQRTITTLSYDRVFIHMSPVWMTLGGWWWLLTSTPVYLWYTHYKMQLGVRLFGWFGKRFFCATSQSLPQYEGSLQKVVVGHGIDMSYWPKRSNLCKDSCRLLTVHRLSRSKRVEITLNALAVLPARYTLDIYGIEAEPEYVRELRGLIMKLKLESRVTFHGTVPMDQLHTIYTRHALIINMASETIDKTMLEAMTCGCYPATTSANARAIDPSLVAPADDEPATLATFIEQCAQSVPLNGEQMYAIVERGHSLEGLMTQMDAYIRLGK